MTSGEKGNLVRRPQNGETEARGQNDGDSKWGKGPLSLSVGPCLSMGEGWAKDECNTVEDHQESPGTTQLVTPTLQVSLNAGERSHPKNGRRDSPTRFPGTQTLGFLGPSRSSTSRLWGCVPRLWVLGGW